MARETQHRQNDAKRSDAQRRGLKDGSGSAQRRDRREKPHKVVEHRQVPYDLDVEAAEVLAMVLRNSRRPEDAKSRWLLEKAAVGLAHPHAGAERAGRVIVQLSGGEWSAVMRVIDEASSEELGRVADRITSAVAESRKKHPTK